MCDLDELKDAMSFIEDKTNYYSMFKHVIESCVIARTITLSLWNVSKISDLELHDYTQRINKARQKAITTHKKLVLKRLRENERYHTVESIVESIYDVIF